MIESYELKLDDQKNKLEASRRDVEYHRRAEVLATERITNILESVRSKGIELFPLLRTLVDKARADKAKASEEIRCREPIVKFEEENLERIERELESVKQILASEGNMQVRTPNSEKSD